MIKTIEWKNNRVIMIDQRKLPGRESYVVCSDYRQVIRAIKEMVIRGAPAIGVAAAMGVALGAQPIKTDQWENFLSRFNKICEEIKGARPTAVNLSWAVERMKGLVEKSGNQKIEVLKKNLIREARSLLLSEDRRSAMKAEFSALTSGLGRGPAAVNVARALAEVLDEAQSG